MPYVEQADRDMLYPSSPRLATTSGELNFQISALLKNYWMSKGNYQGINDILGALEGAKLEFTRRVIDIYEQDAMRRNGDMYQGVL